MDKKEKKVVEKKDRKKQILIVVLSVILLIVLVLSVFIIIKQIKDRNKKEEPVQEEVEVPQEEPVVEEKSERIKKLEELKSQNPEIVGILEIDGTKINYPVVQAKDNDYYLTHNYKKEKSQDGALFLDKDYVFSKPSSNLLIYGHNNIGSKEMFVDLIKYKSKDFYNEHKTIRFTTLEEEEEYEIISVFLSRVYYKSEKNVFRYYYFVDAKNEAEFNDYVQNAKKASLYKIDATASYGDKLMTLSTCEYSQTDGRLAVVAKKIKKEEPKQENSVENNQ